jgi:uncharacterized protein (DUF697 family)
MAKQLIKEYASLHAKMDVLIGAAGFFGLAIPALIGAILLQAPVIYRPLARKLEKVYNATADEETQAIIIENVVIGGIADIAGEFSTEFLMSIAADLLSEAGLGVAAGFIPVVGGVAGGMLDYIIATGMTWRVGTMVAIYYQNGGRWVGNRKHTLELANEIIGGLGFGVKDLAARFTPSERPDVNVDLNQIPQRVPEVFETQVRNLRPVISMLMQLGGSGKVREILVSRGVPPMVIDAALAVAARASAGQ